MRDPKWAVFSPAVIERSPIVVPMAGIAQVRVAAPEESLTAAELKLEKAEPDETDYLLAPAKAP